MLKDKWVDKLLAWEIFKGIDTRNQQTVNTSPTLTQTMIGLDDNFS